MSRWLLSIILLAAVSVVAIRSQQGTAPAAPRVVTVLVNFGLTAQAPERWDGKAVVTNGRLAAILDRHFSEGDSIAPEGSWKCVTRRDAVAPYADLHYTEMRPGSQPEVRHQPVGVYLTVEPQPGGRVAIETGQGRFEFALDELGPEPKAFLGGVCSAQLTPAPETLTTAEYEDDEPAIAALPNGDVAVSWVAYKEQADRVFLRVRRGGAWQAAEEVSTAPGDIFRTSLAATADGDLWVFWSQREQARWSLWGRRKRGTAWSGPERISGEGSATFHRAAAGGNAVHVVWQDFAGGQSDIYLRTLKDAAWAAVRRLSESSANDWEPAVAAGADGTAHVVWDSYAAGNYDIHCRSGDGALRKITASPRFQAHASVAVDGRGRPWIAWNESGINWGKDQGFLIPTPLATPLHQQRWIRVGVIDGGRLLTPRAQPHHMEYNAEHPQIAFSGSGALTMVFRHWTRRNSRSIGAPIVWENYVTAYDGTRWSAPQPVPQSAGWIEKHAALARDRDGGLWAAWATDSRPFETQVPGNAEVLAARLTAAPPGRIAAESLAPYSEPFEEAIPVHNAEEKDVAAIRAHTITSGGKTYRIYRGDMHRHTDISQDFKYDGSLFEVYRYGLDAAGFDYIAPTDHQTGYDQEFSWWQNQKYVDLFLVGERFVPLFAYERSLRYPNGHRNIVWAQRGVRTLPVPPAEASGAEGAAKLFEHLRKTGGISMPHSSATAQGTDWRDNDPQVEPLIEIYQGYRTSYEYEGAPRAATTLNQHAQKSGWQPEGFWWNALDKGYKLGVQASSDHWSTHISYACLIAERPTREGLLEAIRKRHAYAATDNIILDFRARSGSAEYLQGDAFRAAGRVTLSVRVQGTGAIKQVDIIGNKRFLYTARPGAKEFRYEFSDQSPPPGEAWYYVRVLQEDGQIAWSSPVWVSGQ